MLYCHYYGIYFLHFFLSTVEHRNKTRQLTIATASTVVAAVFFFTFYFSATNKMTMETKSERETTKTRNTFCEFIHNFFLLHDPRSGRKKIMDSSRKQPDQQRQQPRQPNKMK